MRYKLLFIIPVFMILAAGCSNTVDIEVNSSWEVTDGFTMQLAQTSYPPNVEKISVIMENNTEFFATYPTGWIIEQYKAGEWQELNTTDIGVDVEVTESIPNYARGIFTVWTREYSKPLDEGIYRLTSRSTVKLFPSANIYISSASTEYPHCHMDFIISETAEPEDIIPNIGSLYFPPETYYTLGTWQLPDLEYEWQWFMPNDITFMYDHSGMNFAGNIISTDTTQVAVLYSDNNSSADGGLYLLDVVDRRTGERRVILDEPAVESVSQVAPQDDGFLVVLADGSEILC